MKEKVPASFKHLQANKTQRKKGRQHQATSPHKHTEEETHTPVVMHCIITEEKLEFGSSMFHQALQTQIYRSLPLKQSDRVRKYFRAPLSFSLPADARHRV